MSHDFKISRLAELGVRETCRYYDVTARALRFYEQRGLIVARRDHLNHRWFGQAARERLAWIAPLRRAGLSLAEIECVLASEAPANTAVERLHHHATVLEARLAALAAFTAKLEACANTSRPNHQPSRSAVDPRSRRRGTVPEDDLAKLQ